MTRLVLWQAKDLGAAGAGYSGELEVVTVTDHPH